MTEIRYVITESDYYMLKAIAANQKPKVLANLLRDIIKRAEKIGGLQRDKKGGPIC